ncbi:diacylglycerol kinase family protein [Algoriphagus sp.]|uniref:diacylglycerol/lipid kinase family protein n=1 Tax=Algoriphagus sp. TaxID=1872435 RepID=UPI0032905D65
MARKCLIIYNPVSGNNTVTHDSLMEMARVRMPDFSVEIWETTGEDDAQKIRSTYANTTPDVVIIGGGDGTVKLVAKSLHGIRVPLCILPLGSANGLAKCMGIDDIVSSWEAVRTFAIQPIDAIHINEEICLHLADFGTNANLIQKFEQEETRGMLGYVKNGLSEILNAEEKRFVLKIGDRTIDVLAKMLVIANGDQYGTGAIVNGGGLMHDGKFEVVTFNPETADEYLKITVGFLKGDFKKQKWVQKWTLEACEIVNPDGVMFQIDGELMGSPEAISAKIEKHAFQFLTGKSYTAHHTS